MATTLTNQMLEEYTSLRVGGLADTVIVATTQAEIISTVQSCDFAGTPLLILGGGSNVVISDDGWRGTVLLIRTTGFEVSADACSGAMVIVEAGQNWDDFVAATIEREWSGVEALSGIPGTVGATPIQNVGAYGQDVSQTIAHVRTFDRVAGEVKTFYFADCAFDYRSSIFKKDPSRYVILDVAFQLRLGHHSQPVVYPELASALNIEVGARSTCALVRTEVLKLRNAKAMVLNPLDHDTWSVGSFFTNPIVSPEIAAALPTEVPRWPQADGDLKLSAAWLVENVGNQKGFGLNERACISSRHSLAITNAGDATASDIMELAEHVRRTVQAKFGIQLAIEPNVISQSA